jgi:hypothetical protein
MTSSRTRGSIYRILFISRRADDAKQRAARASEPFWPAARRIMASPGRRSPNPGGRRASKISYKSAYEKTAECWTVLARIESFLHDDEKDNETPSN